MIAVSFVTILTWFYILNLIAGLIFFAYCLFTGETVEYGAGTYFVSSLISGLLLLGVLTYL